MASSFASQLQAIASKSSNELDLKARRQAHAESLIFEKEVAIKQDFATIYNICVEGFKELCHLDQRFHDFDRNLFAEQATSQDREALTATQNGALDLVLRRCLMLLSGKILLKPALKALEWLVRRFRVHIYNVDDLLLALLPYHEVSVWANVLSIVPPSKLTGQWKFIRPYLNTTWIVPRHAIAYAASNNDAFFAQLNSFTLGLCRQGYENTIYMSFWSGIVVEAVATRLAHTRSGRKEVQSQRREDLLLKVLPMLNEGFEIGTSVDLMTTCYTITIVLAVKAELADPVLDSLLLEICQTLQRDHRHIAPALVTASVIVSQKHDAIVPRKVVTTLSALPKFVLLVRDAAVKQSCQPLLSALVRSTVVCMKPKNFKNLTQFINILVHLMSDLYPENLVEGALVPIVAKSMEMDNINDSSIAVRQQLVMILQGLNGIDSLSTAISQAATFIKHDNDDLEALLGMTVQQPSLILQRDDDDKPMPDVSESAHDEPTNLLESLPSTWDHGSSFLEAYVTEGFNKLSQTFANVAMDPVKLGSFMNLSIWSSTPDRDLLWQSFLIRFASSGHQSHTRQKALRLLSAAIDSNQACDDQYLVPYLLMLLNDVKEVRQTSANLLNKFQAGRINRVAKPFKHGLYNANAMHHITDLSPKQVSSLLADVIQPVLEECVLDQNHIIRVVQSVLHVNSTADVKKSHRQALFNLLTQHALASPLIRLKAVFISMLDKVQKVGGKSKSKVLLPILQEWSKLSVEQANTVAGESGLSTDQIDAALVQLIDIHDGHYLDQISQAADLADSGIRSGLVRATFEYMRKYWDSWTSDEQLSSAGTLFNIAFAPNDPLSAGAQGVLRSVELSSSVLAALLQLSEVGTGEVRGPPSKKKRRSSSGTSQSRVDVIKTIDKTTAKISLALELVESNSPQSKPELLTVMFEMLACLKQLQQNRVESPYLLNLCLSSINAMTRSPKTTGTFADLSGIKPELVTECLRSSDNPQVQNTSLLVMAALSSVVPDRMIHNVMPIFTFIGHNMLSKDDEHSINVVNEAIDRIVPALLQSLRKGRNAQAYQSSMSSMLASFTSAYEHIPRHRRVAFYQKLLFSIDACEFGFILVALLAAQERRSAQFTKFLEELINGVSPAHQLAVYQRLIHLSVDVLAAAPKNATVIYNISRATSMNEKLSFASANLAAAIVILKNPTLAASVKSPTKFDTIGSEVIRDQLRISFEVTLTAIRDLGNCEGAVTELAKQSLDALLQLPKITTLVNMIDSTLDSMEETQLRPQALRVLSIQLKNSQKKSLQARESATSLVPKLNRYVGSHNNRALVQASLTCLDSITEIYGRKYPEIIVSIAENITTHGLASFKDDANVLEAVILALASVVETTKEGFVPLVSGTISQTLNILDSSVDDVVSSNLFSAMCSLLSAIVSNAAFMISQEQITKIIETMVSVVLKMDEPESNEDFALLLRSVAQKVELEMVIEASTSILEKTRDSQEQIATLVLGMLGQTMDTVSKTVVIRQADSISRVFQIAFGIKATSSTNDSIPDTGEDTSLTLLDQLKSTSIKFIYKINDTTFRPIFESWIDWANSSDDQTTIDATTVVTRQITLFETLTHFFSTLASIVTSYASYLLPTISAILTSANSASLPSRPPDDLLTTTLSLLRTMTTHDQDSFFSAPSHFDAIAEPLITTLNLAVQKSKRPLIANHIIPTIVSLAKATMDSPATHSTLVHHIVSLKSHSSSHVRLASIQTLLALSEDEELADDFIANVVGIGAGEGEGARGGGASVGEVMVYVNEMLEDDDEGVEMEVRRWVQVVRGRVGEDVFEV